MRKRGPRPITERFDVPQTVFTEAGRFTKSGTRYVSPEHLREQIGRNSPGPLAMSVMEDHYNSFGKNRTGTMYPRPKTTIGRGLLKPIAIDGKRAAQNAGLRYEILGPLRKPAGWDSPGPAYMTHIKNRSNSPKATIGSFKRFTHDNTDSPGPIYTYRSAFTQFNRAMAIAEERERARKKYMLKTQGNTAWTTTKKTKKIRPKHMADLRRPFGEAVPGQASPGPGAYVYDPGFQKSLKKLRARVHTRTTKK